MPIWQLLGRRRGFNVDTLQERQEVRVSPSSILVSAAVVAVIFATAATAGALTEKSLGREYEAAKWQEQQEFAGAAGPALFPGSTGEPLSDRTAMLTGCLGRKVSAAFSRSESVAARNLARPLSELSAECAAEIEAQIKQDEVDRAAARALLAPKATIRGLVESSRDVRYQFSHEAAQRLRPEWDEGLRGELAVHLRECMPQAAPSRQGEPLATYVERCVGTFRSVRILDGEMTGEDYMLAGREQQVQYAVNAVMFVDMGASRIKRAANAVFVDECLRTSMTASRRSEATTAASNRKLKLGNMVDSCLIMRELAR